MKNKISRRNFLSMVGTSAAAMTVGGCQLKKLAAKKQDKPNIVLIMADDMSSSELGCYGSKEHNTPNLDKLAEEGIFFETCWSTPLCRPTRGMIMTGRYAFRTGWYHNYLMPAKPEEGKVLSETNIVFSEALKKAGYRTCISDKWQLYGSPKDHSFDEVCLTSRVVDPGVSFSRSAPHAMLPNRPSYYWKPAIVQNGIQIGTTWDDYGPDMCTDFVIDFIKDNKDKPFLAYYPTHLPHKHWDPFKERHYWVTTPELGEDGKPTGKKGEGSLKSNVEYLDYLVGRIVNTLEEQGLRDNTLILFTSDNGTAEKHGKGSTYLEKGVRVPMIANCPGLVKKQGSSGALIDLSDVMATLCDFGGASLPKDYEIDGVSFGPILRGEKSDTREWIFSYLLDERMLRDKRWLLDGRNNFWDTKGRRDCTGYENVTDSDDPKVVAARKRFEKILEDLPGPDKNSDTWQQYLKLKARRKAEVKKVKELQKKGEKKKD